MKFATIAASVLVASSVLATAGVVSANSGIGTYIDDKNYSADGTASVTVEKGADAQFTIDRVPGIGTTQNSNGELVANDLNFGSVTLTQLAQSEQKMPAKLNKGAFAVTNTMGVQSWQLNATMHSFKNKAASDEFPGALKINDVSLNPEQDTPLYSSATAEGFSDDNGSKSKWISPVADAEMVVPTTAKLGDYTANITYKLSATPTADTTSNHDTTLTDNPVGE